MDPRQKSCPDTIADIYIPAGATCRDKGVRSFAPIGDSSAGFSFDVLTDAERDCGAGLRPETCWGRLVSLSLDLTGEYHRLAAVENVVASQGTVNCLAD